MTAQTTSLEKIIVLDFGSRYNQLITPYSLNSVCSAVTTQRHYSQES